MFSCLHTTAHEWHPMQLSSHDNHHIAGSSSTSRPFMLGIFTPSAWSSAASCSAESGRKIFKSSLVMQIFSGAPSSGLVHLAQTAEVVGSTAGSYGPLFSNSTLQLESERAVQDVGRLALGNHQSCSTVDGVGA